MDNPDDRYAETRDAWGNTEIVANYRRRSYILPAEVRASSFLGLVEEFAIGGGTAELRAIQPYTGKYAGPVSVSIAPDDCIVLAGA